MPEGHGADRTGGPATRAVEVGTPQGTARAHVHPPADGGSPTALLALGHGAGGGVHAPDLVATTDVATRLGLAVALVEQPYRVAGRRAGPRAPALDAAWTVVVGTLREVVGDVPLVVGGRSAGARVACRTARGTGAAGVLCLAFPLRPPRRPDAPDRLGELDPVPVPVLVVQGARDPYGVPPEARGRTVVVVRGDHALRGDVGALRDAVRAWLPGVVPVRT